MAVRSNLIFKKLINQHHAKYLISFRRISNFEEQKIDVNGSKINVVISGNPNSKKAVFLMPGALGTALTDFEPQIKQLPSLLKDYKIISWDAPGYGKSIPPNRYFGLDFYKKDADTAVKLLQKLHFNSCDLLGWSDGGISGMIVAGNYPSFVRKLVIWGANAYIHEDEIKIYESIKDVNKWSTRMREPMENVYGKKEFAKLWSDWVDAVINIYKAQGGNLCKEVLPKITAKTLILHGAKDPMIVAEHVPYLLNNIKNSDIFVFKEGKHNIHLKYAEEFNKLVADFLQK